MTLAMDGWLTTQPEHMMNTLLVELVRGVSDHYKQRRDGAHPSGNGTAEWTKNIKEVKNRFVLSHNYGL